MAYYSSDVYQGDAGEYHKTPYYTTSYDTVPFQDSISYSSYEFSEPRGFEYNSTAYNGAYNGGAYDFDQFLTRSEINYSTYNPIPYGSTSHFYSETQYTISYSTSTELGDIEFAEYDPTPYGGGYDPTLTYGKPLPPSDEICHPRSLPESNGLSSDNFSYASIPSPYGKDDTGEYSAKPQNGTKPTKSTEEQQQQPPNGGTGENGHDPGLGNHPEKALDSNQGEQKEGYTYDDYCYPWSGYDYGVRNGRNGECGCRFGDCKHVPQTQYGYGLDGMDLCESIFGYWPCLDRYNRQNYGHREVAREDSQENQLGFAADSLFGSPYSHGGDEAGDYGEPSYNYERHYQEQHYRQVEGDENSWVQNFKMF